ncbi:ribosomal RNA processing protein 36 homolog isoform X2 [Photinus pyralis]|nr:ribosomal RNA processing protein 36 homolog isoform X2 [Photinus pyralis]
MSFEELIKLKEEIGAKEYNNIVLPPNEKSKAPRSFKRENKNRPRERSSKIPVSRLQMENTKKPNSRDPRFDPLCGNYDEKIFRTNYKFVKDIRMKEREQLAKELKKEKDPDKKHKIKLLIQRMDNQNREYDKRDKQRETQEGERKVIRQTLRKGQKPVFKKKSEKRLENLISKYEDLKSTNKLQKHMEKRYKKLAQKERKNK